MFALVGGEIDGGVPKTVDDAAEPKTPVDADEFVLPKTEDPALANGDVAAVETGGEVAEPNTD